MPKRAARPPHVRYIEVYDGDKRSYREKHNDVMYLKDLANMQGNGVWITQTQYALECMRNLKDLAETTEELKGINKCLRVVKELAYSPFKATDTLAIIQQQRELAG